MLSLVIPARKRTIGLLEVGRILPFAQRRMVGPFIFLDHIGPLELPPEIPRETDVRPHPHIGLSTVTYLFDGEITHRDSLGFEQVIKPGAVNWMAAGQGIAHSERFDGLRHTGGRLHGLQAWVAMPARDEEAPADFTHYPESGLPTFKQPGVEARLIAGSAYGLGSKVKTHSPLFYIHAEMQPGADLELPAEHKERAAYVVRGRVEHDARSYQAGDMLVFSFGDASLRAEEPSTVMLLGGEPLGTRHIWWNFVSSRKERIDQAKADWQAGRFKLPAHDDQEFIPLPQEPKEPKREPEAEPMS
jgi:redox-sensitive bicupin YhaK (pirin superfamily)